MDQKNVKYIVLTILLLILSGFGIFLIFKINSSSNSTEIVEEIISTPTKNPPTGGPIIEITPIVTVTPSKIASPSPTKKPTITPTATPSAKITPTVKPTITPTVTPIITATPTVDSSAQLTFTSSTDGFSIGYSSLRKLYQDKESTGNRYTFYSSSGNFAVHVAPSGIWSWTNSDRNFNQTLIVSGQNTYRYDITTQTIVDLQSSTKNYTIQCVHNGKESLKTECEAFIRSFQLL